MLTLEETLQEQENLAQLCSDRPLETAELFSGNAFYGADFVLKQYSHLPQEYCLKVVVPHGISFNDTFAWSAEVNAPVPAVFHFSQHSRRAYFKAIQKANFNKQLIPAASTFLYVIELLKEQPRPLRKGTIFFPAHSTHRVTAHMDLEALAEALTQLDQQYQPVTVCLYWRDFNLGRHQPFQKRGMPIVSCGHMFDPLFLFRFYHLCSQHLYASSNEFGSHLFYSIKAGCTFFHLDASLPSYSTENEAISKNDIAGTDIAQMTPFQSLFTPRLKNVSTEQLQLVDQYIGTASLKSPEALQRQLLGLESLYSLQYKSSDFATTDRPTLISRLEEIPSETTLAERQLLYSFFSQVWSGRHHVCEIGSFLGGTSRAIAMGMLDHPSLQSDAKLYTYDRFENYYTSDRLIEYLQPLIQQGTLDRDTLENVADNANFLPIFEAIHAKQPYSSLIVANRQSLPSSKETEAETVDLFQLPSTLEFSAVFVDGCKSWYATKYFMSTVCPHTQPDAYFLFQDYGWYTCFWIPIFLYLFRDTLKLISSIDNTYIFQLIAPLNRETIDRLCPDALNQSHQELIDSTFINLWLAAQQRHDIRSMVVLTLQHAAALAYIGCLEAARAKMIHLTTQTWAKDYRPLIEPALRQPTYYPDGTPINLFSAEEIDQLWQEAVWLNPYQAELTYWQTQSQHWQQEHQQTQVETGQLHEKLNQAQMDLKAIPDLQETLRQTKSRLQKSRQRVQRLTTQLEQTKTQLEAIEHSKFWKLRSLWMQFKRMIRWKT